jgi:hypothetical protein
MNSFKNWYVSNQDAITWFLIGVLTQAMIYNFSHGDWLWTAITALLIWTNYKLRNVRLK